MLKERIYKCSAGFNCSIDGVHGILYDVSEIEVELHEILYRGL